MDMVLLIARLTLAAVFSVAGAAKLADREGSRRALTGFGVPENLAGPLARGLPIVEIVIALALILRDTAWGGAIGAASLLMIFAVAIGVSLARGNSPDCHCFGQLRSEPISWSLVARNVALAAVAGLIVARGEAGMSALSWLSDLRTGEVVSLIFSLFAAGMLVSVFAMLRKSLARQTELLETVSSMKKVIDEDYAEPAPIEREDAEPPVEGLPVGAIAPSFSLAALDGNQAPPLKVSLGNLLGFGKSVLLLFVSPNCSPCKSLLPVVRVWERDYGDHLTVVLLSKGSVKEVQSKLARYKARHLLLLGESAIADEYQANWTPAAVLISPDGKIASQVMVGDDAIRALVNHTIATGAFQPAENPADNKDAAINIHQPRIAARIAARITAQITVGSSLFKVGEPAPRFELPDLRGKSFNTEALLGRDTLLLFWDAQCPFCQAMFEDLRRWEENPPKGAPRLVYIASGDVKEARNKHEGLKSLTLLDEEFDIAPLFGSNIAPSAVLIDSEGKIASSLAKGAQNILALIGIRRVELPIASGLARSSAKEQAAKEPHAQDSIAEIMAR